MAEAFPFGRRKAFLFCHLKLVGKRDGTLASIKAEIALPRREAGFFISPDLETEVLELAGE